MADKNPFIGLSTISLQDALLRRLNELANLRHEARDFRRQLRMNKAKISDAEDELRQICSALHEVNVVPFSRILDYLRVEVPEESRAKRKLSA